VAVEPPARSGRTDDIRTARSERVAPGSVIRRRRIENGGLFIMKQEDKITRPVMSAVFIVLSALYATAVATGALTICLSVIARVNGTSFVEYYQYVFPRLRGGTPGIHIPLFAYVAFMLYIGVAALVAIHSRKRIAGAWSHRRHMR
jgi:hypothetical protein